MSTDFVWYTLIWLDNYANGDDARKAHLLQMARTPSGGT